MIKVAYSFKSQRTDKNQAFSQVADSSTNLRYESLITVAWLATVWLKEGDYQILKYSLKFVRSMSEIIDFFWSLLYIFNTARLIIPIYLGSSIIRLFISQSLTVLGTLGEKFNIQSMVSQVGDWGIPPSWLCLPPSRPCLPNQIFRKQWEKQ